MGPEHLLLPGRLEAAYRSLSRENRGRGEDLALIAPSGYADYSVVPIAEAEDGREIMLKVSIVERSIIKRPGRRELFCVARDASGTVVLRFLKFAAWQYSLLEPGKTAYLFGSIKKQLADASVTHPLIINPARALPDHLVAGYPKISKVPAAQIGQIADAAAAAVARLPDILPASFCSRYALLPMAETLRRLHRPRSEDELADAIKSLKFREWLALLLSQRAEYRKNSRRSGIRIESRPADSERFAAALPFALTAGQIAAMGQIGSDLEAPHAMRRLLYGDVGCGKTVVAAYACWLCARSGHTAAIMAPTEILAQQHTRRLADLFENLGVECELLTGSTPASGRTKIMARLARQPGRCVIGTHALFQGTTVIPELGLAVIDEQHRFGVKQRQALADKNERSHVLMMSATPIPRTLILGLYANVEVTRIRDRPFKTPVTTMIIRRSRAEEVIEALRRDSLQAYWISPLIKKSDRIGVQAAEEEYRRLVEKAPDLNPTLIHGKMSSAEKARAMASFEAGRTRVLVATTVVEVGLDAPEADAVVITGAERFGLSQLHQLRGRVGRAQKRGFCALLYGEKTTAAALRRLKAIHGCSDGFAIAQQDLHLRGPGDIAGVRQSGIPICRFASFADDEEILEQIPEAADLLLRDHPEQAKDHWRFWLGRSSRLPIRFARPASAGRAGRRAE